MSIEEVAKRLREYVGDSEGSPAKRPKESHIDSFLEIGQPVITISELHQRGIAILRESSDTTASLAGEHESLKIGLGAGAVATTSTDTAGVKDHPEFKFLETLTGFYNKSDPLELLSPVNTLDKELREKAETVRTRLTTARTELRASLELLRESSEDLQQLLKDLERVSTSNRFIEDGRRLSADYDTYQKKILNLSSKKARSKVWVDAVSLFTTPKLSGLRPGTLYGAIANPANKESPTYKEISAVAKEMAVSVSDGRNMRTTISRMEEVEKPTESDVKFLLKYIFYSLMYNTPLFLDSKSTKRPNVGLTADIVRNSGNVDESFEGDFSTIDEVKDFDLGTKGGTGTATRAGGSKRKTKDETRKLGEVTITTDPEKFIKALNNTDVTSLDPVEVDTRAVVDAFKSKITEVARAETVTDVSGKTAAEIELDLEQVETDAQALIDSLPEGSTAKKSLRTKLRDLTATATYPAIIALKGWLTEFTDTLEVPLMGSTKDNIGKISGLTEVVREKQELVVSLVNQLSDVTSRLVVRVNKKEPLPYLPGVKSAISGCFGILSTMYSRRNFSITERTKTRILTVPDFLEPFAQAVANYLFVYIKDIKFPTVWRPVGTAIDAAINQIGTPLISIGKHIDRDGFLVIA